MSSYTVKDLLGDYWESKEFKLKEQVFSQLIKEIEEKFMKSLRTKNVRI